jgi:hypothetical protein
MLFSKEFLLLIVVTDLKSENKRQDVLRMNSIIYSLELEFLLEFNLVCFLQSQSNTQLQLQWFILITHPEIGLVFDN